MRLVQPAHCVVKDVSMRVSARGQSLISVKDTGWNLKQLLVFAGDIALLVTDSKR